MSESGKNRLWSLLLLCSFAVVLTVCNKAMDSSSEGSSSSGTAFADGSTVTISSQALENVSAILVCYDADSAIYNSGTYYFHGCDSTDST